MDVSKSRSATTALLSKGSDFAGHFQHALMRGMPLAQNFGNGSVPVRTKDGRVFRALNTIDEFTKEALVIRKPPAAAV